MPAKPSVNKCDEHNSMVNRHIGTAYDNVRIVAEHIAEVINLADGIEAVSLYLGAFSTPPTEGWNGEPLKSGNFYLNTTTNTVDYYDEEDDTWIFVDAESVVQAAQTAIAARDAALLAQAAAELAETNAESSAAAALLSEQNAALSEDTVLDSANAAAVSEANASTSESNALASENAAKASEIAAAQSESNAITSEINASNSASAAAQSEFNAAQSEVNAGNFATQAAQSAADAEAAFDNFNDLYLGAKATDPTTDNDGNPLQVGATYWNTATNDLRFWNGAVWDVPEQTAIQAAADAVAARDDAQISETNAAASAAAASTSETNAGTSEANALASEQAAALSESTAATSASNASTSESNAATSASNAATSEANAAQSAEDAASIVPSLQAQIDDSYSIIHDSIALASGFEEGKILGIVESGTLKQYEVGATDLGSGIQMADGKFANPTRTYTGYISGNSVSVTPAPPVTPQGVEATSVGNLSGANNQGDAACSFGSGSGQTSQSDYACSFGRLSGSNNQGLSSVAIGKSAGQNNQPASSIVINADISENTPAGTKQIVIGRSDYSVFIGDGNVQSVSDIRDKYDIQDIPIGLDFVNSLRPLFYKYDIRDLYSETYDSGEVINFPVDRTRAGKRFHAGFGAQHVKESMDKAGVDFGVYRDLSINAEEPHKERTKDRLALCYIELIPVLTKAIQEVDEKTKEIESLKHEMQMLNDRIYKIEEAININNLNE